VASFARPDHLAIDVPIIALVLALVGLPCITLWAGSGSMLQGLLSDRRTLRAFNVGMAALLVASILPSIWHAVSGALQG
jgi:threonine/homoserine/homoserine lactone efflux protein